MRHLLPVLFFAAASSVGCQANCPAPQTLNGQTFYVFANVIEQLNAQQLDLFTDAPDFLSYGSPMNGHGAWVIDWGPHESGAVTVTIDGQPFQGRGEWDPIECGHFGLNFDGEYVAPEGTRHIFTTSGVFVTYEGHLAGEMLWVQSWVADDGRSGSWRGRVGVVGHR